MPRLLRIECEDALYHVITHPVRPQTSDHRPLTLIPRAEGGPAHCEWRKADLPIADGRWRMTD